MNETTAVGPTTYTCAVCGGSVQFQRPYGIRLHHEHTFTPSTGEWKDLGWWFSS
jgi:hypothetical protein